MGPQLYRCGNYTYHISYTRHVRASMGPQLYRCGNYLEMPDLQQRVDPLQWGRNFIVAETPLEAGPRSIRALAASMGPQLYRCGNIASGGASAEKAQGFNGAATLSLRKRSPTWRPCRPAATLQWGRNFIVAETVSFQSSIMLLSYASMGPQLYRCGNEPAPYRSTMRLVASMGPQLYRCGNVDLLSLIMEYAIASMGPQLYRCGNPALRPRRPLQGLASMGPQLYRCGNLSCDFSQPCKDWLQWGRNFIVAETVFYWTQYFMGGQASMGPQLYRCGNLYGGGTTSQVSTLLQWGRNFIVAETCNLSWRCRTIESKLQWGRNFIVAETYYHTRSRKHVECASMGPQLYRCGNFSLGVNCV